MSTARALAITKDLTIPISLGLLGFLVLGVWALAIQVGKWESRLDAFDRNQREAWTYRMERDSWTEAHKLNPNIVIPNISEIRRDNL